MNSVFTLFHSSLPPFPVVPLTPSQIHNLFFIIVIFIYILIYIHHTQTHNLPSPYSVVICISV